LFCFAAPSKNRDGKTYREWGRVGKTHIEKKKWEREREKEEEMGELLVSYCKQRELREKENFLVAIWCNQTDVEKREPVGSNRERVWEKKRYAMIEGDGFLLYRNGRLGWSILIASNCWGRE